MQFEVIDTHCHLDFPVFDQGRDELLVHCQMQGIKHFIVPALAPESWQRLAYLADAYPCVSYALGVHPWFIMSAHVKMFTHACHQWLALNHRQCVALGETGLDAHCQTPWALQCQMFQMHLDLARQWQKPLIIHSCKANDAVYAMLRRAHLPAGGVIHGFTGSLQQAQRFWSLGFRLGVGHVILFKRAQKTRRTFACMPASALLLETDAPQKMMATSWDWPDLLQQILLTLSQLRHTSSQILAEQLLENTRVLFGHHAS